jgi:hypothetical protein
MHAAQAVQALQCSTGDAAQAMQHMPCSTGDAAHALQYRHCSLGAGGRARRALFGPWQHQPRAVGLAALGTVGQL